MESFEYLKDVIICCIAENDTATIQQVYEVVREQGFTGNIEDAIEELIATGCIIRAQYHECFFL